MRFVMITTVILTTFLLGGCRWFESSDTHFNPGETAPGAAPVYQGMVLSDTVPTVQSNPWGLLSRLSFFTALSASLNESQIKDILAEELPFENTDNIDYFSKVNEDVFITVKLFNPDGQAILRFTLNGVVYQSFQFHPGSDSENLILRVNAGAISGIWEFTIDEIKYVENETNEIKDALFEGDRTVRLGVAFSDLPRAQLSELSLSATSLKVTATIIDPNDLMTATDQPLKAFLIHQGVIVDKVDLELGANTITFFQLSPRNEYAFVIATVIDILDGKGKQITFLEDVQLFTTETIVNFEEVAVAQDSITFAINVTDADEVGNLSLVELYQGETLIEALTDLSLRTFTDLLSNNTYQIQVTYTYDLNDGEGIQSIRISETVTTLAKELPQISFNAVTATQDSVSFNIEINDPDNVGTVSAISLYQGETLFATSSVMKVSDLGLSTFEGLLSDTEYKIEVIYQFDVNEGKGSEHSIFEMEIQTSPNNTISTIRTQNSINYFGDPIDIVIEYESSRLSAIKYIVVNNEKIVPSNQTRTRIILRINDDLINDQNKLNFMQIVYLNEFDYENIQLISMNAIHVNTLDSISLKDLNTREPYNYVNLEMIEDSSPLYIYFRLENTEFLENFEIKEITMGYLWHGYYVYNPIEFKDIFYDSSTNEYYFDASLIFDYDGQANKTYAITKIIAELDGVLFDTNIETEYIYIRSGQGNLTYNEIHSLEDFLNILFESNVVNVLMSDIDLDNVDWNELNSELNSKSERRTLLLDGNNFTIYNFRQDFNTSDFVRIGLFPELYNSYIHDLNIHDIEIDLIYTGSRGFFIGPVSHLVESSILENITITGDINILATETLEFAYISTVIAGIQNSYSLNVHSTVSVDYDVTASRLYFGYLYGSVSGYLIEDRD